MCAESIKREGIKREHIEYLVCSACGVVFPDRGNPQDCPICAQSGSVTGAFLPYPGSKDGAETSH